jgi:hypothetical protein
MFYSSDLMAEVGSDIDGSDLGGSAPTAGKQSCVRCSAPNPKAVSMSSVAVYLRCGSCGEVWSIPQRRKQTRPDDPRSF